MIWAAGLLPVGMQWSSVACCYTCIACATLWLPGTARDLDSPSSSMSSGLHLQLGQGSGGQPARGMSQSLSGAKWPWPQSDAKWPRPQSAPWEGPSCSRNLAVVRRDIFMCLLQAAGGVAEVLAQQREGVFLAGRKGGLPHEWGWDALKSLLESSRFLSPWVCSPSKLALLSLCPASCNFPMAARSNCFEI